MPANNLDLGSRWDSSICLESGYRSNKGSMSCSRSSKGFLIRFHSRKGGLRRSNSLHLRKRKIKCEREIHFVLYSWFVTIWICVCEISKSENPESDEAEREFHIESFKCFGLKSIEVLN